MVDEWRRNRSVGVRDLDDVADLSGAVRVNAAGAIDRCRTGCPAQPRAGGAGEARRLDGYPGGTRRYAEEPVSISAKGAAAGEGFGAAARRVHGGAEARRATGTAAPGADPAEVHRYRHTRQWRSVGRAERW